MLICEVARSCKPFIELYGLYRRYWA